MPTSNLPIKKAHLSKARWLGTGKDDRPYLWHQNCNRSES